MDVELSPAFLSGTLEYDADVTVAQVTVAPTASDADATVAYLDGNSDAIADADTGADGHQVDLEAGSNTVKIAVSKDGLTTTYTVALFRLVTQQQTADVTLVSNLGEADQGSGETIADGGTEYRSQRFSTGSNEGGYNVTSVVIDLVSVPADPTNLIVNIRNAVGAVGIDPGTRHVTLNPPATLVVGNNTYTAAANSPVLAKDTYYHLRYRYTGSGSFKVKVTNSGSVDSGAATGWDIHNHSRYSTTGSSWTRETNELKMQIRGSEVSANNAATGAPTISGTNLVGQTLTANKGSIADTDGLPLESTFTYQWIRVSQQGTQTDITGATSNTYTPVAADAGKFLKVKVNFTDSAGHAESRTSSESEVIGATTCTPAAPQDAIWSACMTVGLQSTVVRGYYFDSQSPEQNHGALSNTGFTVGGTTYTLNRLADVGTSTLLTFTSAPGNAASDWVLHIGSASTSFALSAATTSNAGETYTWTGNSLTWSGGDVISVWIAPPPNTEATGEPTISGTNLVGQTLTANKGSIADADGVPAESTFTYQWIRVSGSTETDITGATSKTW